MTLIIGIDPHKASHTAVAIGGDEQQSAEIRVRATSQQTQQLLAWAEPLGKKTWAVESAGGMGYLLSQQLVGAGEQVLDVTATLASHTGGPSSGVQVKWIIYRDPATPSGRTAASGAPPMEYRVDARSSGRTSTAGSHLPSVAYRRSRYDRHVSCY